MGSTLDSETMIVALLVVSHLDEEEENIYPRGITMLRIFAGVEVVIR